MEVGHNEAPEKTKAGMGSCFWFFFSFLLFHHCHLYIWPKKIYNKLSVVLFCSGIVVTIFFIINHMSEPSLFSICGSNVNESNKTNQHWQHFKVNVISDQTHVCDSYLFSVIHPLLCVMMLDLKSSWVLGYVFWLQIYDVAHEHHDGKKTHRT